MFQTDVKLYLICCMKLRLIYKKTMPYFLYGEDYMDKKHVFISDPILYASRCSFQVKTDCTPLLLLTVIIVLYCITPYEQNKGLLNKRRHWD